MCERFGLRAGYDQVSSWAFGDFASAGLDMFADTTAMFQRTFTRRAPCTSSRNRDEAHGRKGRLLLAGVNVGCGMRISSVCTQAREQAQPVLGRAAGGRGEHDEFPSWFVG
jgi:hypothetical protein